MADDNPTQTPEMKPISWEVKAEPLKSGLPLIGPLITWIRNSVNSISTKWYLIPILQQQNLLNQRLAEQSTMLQQQLSDQDHEISQIVHDMAEISSQLVQMNKILADLEAELAQMESKKAADGD